MSSSSDDSDSGFLALGGLPRFFGAGLGASSSGFLTLGGRPRFLGAGLGAASGAGFGASTSFSFSGLDSQKQ